jgi:putative ABC transport system permease protein
VEVEAIAALPLIRAAAPMELAGVDNIKYGNQRVKDATTISTTPEYETVHDAFVERGRFLIPADVERGAQVAVIGTDVVDTLFPNVDPIDKEITLDGRRFRVVGVMERKGKFLFQSRDNIILLPRGAFQKRNERFHFLIADVKPISPAVLKQAEDQIRETLRRKRKLRFLEKDNFGVVSQDTLTDLYSQITGGIYMVMIAISSIGLLVGGVGVMNIMLVSVTERTREIGVRKALGAKKRDILWQFLTEAMTLTGTGGILGILIGAIVAYLVNAFSPFPARMQPAWVLIAFLTSVAVGLFFGLWPAAKAARLDPIEALRYE